MTATGIEQPRPLNRAVEWPTVAVAAAIYGAFAALTLNHAALPAWVLVLAGGYVVAWHGSLQHEVVHGHPTRWRRVNELLVAPSLWLWLPYQRYRATHLEHHRDPRSLTLPGADPESYYVARGDERHPVRRLVAHVNNTLAGRLLVGPVLVVAELLGTEARRLARGDRESLRAWAWHAAGSALVLWWVLGVCGMPALTYLGAFVYPGIAFTLLRSFSEHEARPEPSERTTVVAAGPLMSLLYLNNNLHVIHHERPGVAWYDLPRLWQARRERFAAEHPERLHPGYLSIARRFALRAKEPVEHPFA